MLRIETVEPGMMDLLRRLMADEYLKEFVLVGGTALSLQIGHRKSIDIDLFAARDFNAPILASYIESRYKPERMNTLKNGIFSKINKVKVDMLAHQYPYINPPFMVDGIRMLSLEDLGAMKLHAIVENGTRVKDFVDVYRLLEHRPLKDLTRAYVSKYPDKADWMAHKALVYHEDIEPAVIGFIGNDIKLDEMKRRFQDAILQQNKIFKANIQEQKNQKSTKKEKPQEPPGQKQQERRQQKSKRP